MIDVTATQTRMTDGIVVRDRFGQLRVLDETGWALEGRLAMAWKAVRDCLESTPCVGAAIPCLSAATRRVAG